MYNDKVIVCKQCGKEFVFSARDQEFYAEKGYTNEPKSCKECRKARAGADRPAREMFKAVCTNCGGEALVPFNPTSGKPIYCAACFAAMRQQR
ncbi:MAG: zinc-ribbon domain containing protein [Firmicutes bacterium]|nr:zinc-ribbon domain containing protein [Candidatus Colimorpha enterica]